MDDHPELSFDEAFEHVWGRRRGSRFINDLVIGFNEVFRSILAAVSPREDLIATIIGIQPALEATMLLIEICRRSRAIEVQNEVAFDAWLGRPTVHDEEHDRFILQELRGCLSDLSAVISRLRRLCAALSKERTAAVSAGIYSDNGSGCIGELAMSMIERGHAPGRLISLLRTIKTKKGLKGRRRTGVMTFETEKAAKAIWKQARRAKASIHSKSQ